MIWYGLFPDPAHSPHTRSGVAPVSVHDAGRASPVAARRAGSSGASASTASALHRGGPADVDIPATIAGPTDILVTRDNSKARRPAPVRVASGRGGPAALPAG